MIFSPLPGLAPRARRFAAVPEFRNVARGCRSGMSKSNQSALAPCVGIMGSSAFGACLRARIGSFPPALVAFAATPRDDIGEIIAAVIVGNLGAYSDVLDGAYDDLWPIVWISALGRHE